MNRLQSLVLTLLLIASFNNFAKQEKVKKITTKSEIVVEGEKKQTAEKKEAKKTRSISIKNNIDRDTMLGYKWGKTYYPDEFVLSINGKELKAKESISCPIENNKVVIHFDYVWASGYRKGSKDVHFDVEPTADKLVVTFNWKDTYQVLVDHAKPNAVKDAPKLKKTAAKKSAIS